MSDDCALFVAKVSFSTTFEVATFPFVGGSFRILDGCNDFSILLGVLACLGVPRNLPGLRADGVDKCLTAVLELVTTLHDGV